MSPKFSNTVFLFVSLWQVNFWLDDLFKKVQLLQSRQDLYLESARLNEVDNTRKLEELDKDISVRRRQVMYDFESDMVYNSKIYSETIKITS